MGWYIFWFCVTVICNTGICWWLWKGTPGEKDALKARIQKLEDDLSSKFKSS